MENYTTAVIGAAGTIVGSAVPVVYAWYKERQTLAPITSVRQKALAGRWQGPGTDVYSENDSLPIQFTLTANFRLTLTRKIRGRAVLSPAGHDTVDVTLEGGFYSEDFIQMAYRSTHRRRRQTGRRGI